MYFVPYSQFLVPHFTIPSNHSQDANLLALLFPVAQVFIHQNLPSLPDRLLAGKDDLKTQGDLDPFLGTVMS